MEYSKSSDFDNKQSNDQLLDGVKNKKSQQIKNMFTFSYNNPNQKDKQPQDGGQQTQNYRQDLQKYCSKLLIAIEILSISTYFLYVSSVVMSNNTYLHQLRILIGIILGFGINHLFIGVIIISLVSGQKYSELFDLCQKYRTKNTKQPEEQNKLDNGFYTELKKNKYLKKLETISEENSSNMQFQKIQKIQINFPEEKNNLKEKSETKTKLQLSLRILNALILLSYIGIIFLVSLNLIIQDNTNVSIVQIIIYSFSITIIYLLCKLNASVEQMIIIYKEQQYIKRQITKTELQIFHLMKKIISQSLPKKHIFKTLQQFIEHLVKKQQIQEKIQQIQKDQHKFSRTQKNSFENKRQNRKLRQKFERLSLSQKMPLNLNTDTIKQKGLRYSTAFRISNIFPQELKNPTTDKPQVTIQLNGQ